MDIDVSGGARVGINGFGRMGRLALRAAWGWPELEFVHINELTGDAATAAHCSRSTRSTAAGATRCRRMTTRSRSTARASATAARAEPGDVPWGELGVDIVLECSGKFRTPESLAPYFERGVRKVIVAAPGQGRAR